MFGFKFSHSKISHECFSHVGKLLTEYLDQKQDVYLKYVIAIITKIKVDNN